MPIPPATILTFLASFPTKPFRGGKSSSKRFYCPVYSKGLPNVRINIINGKTAGQDTWTYDSYGKVKKHTERHFSSELLATSYTYDSFGHAVSVTDPMGFTSENHYTTTGLLDYSQNHKNQTTTYTYDLFGRLKVKKMPSGQSETIAYSWEAMGTNGLYCITQSATGQPVQKTGYDALGREVRQAVQRFDGLWAKTDTQYDIYGRKSKVSLPSTGTSASLWNIYAYDVYDRPKSLTEASGKKTSYSYSGLTTTTVDEGISTARTCDATGKLVKVTDPGGTISYNLRPDGQPFSIVATGNVTTTFSYDVYGRQTAIVDPSAGTTSYVYDAAGNLKQQTDAENRSSKMEYDKFGRITKKSTPELVATYTYETTDNLLASVICDNGTATAYTYDAYGRIVNEKETGADGYWLQKDYVYQSDGNPSVLTYKTRTETVASEHYSYKYGHMAEIKLNGTTAIFKLGSQNALGQVTGVTTGAVARCYQYNSYGLPTGRKAGNVMEAAYNFDATTGNLKSRTDKKRGKTESFKYDKLNRLVAYGANTVSYDIKGNLTEKSDAGTFAYANTAKPYAVSGATLSGTAIPARKQKILYNSFEQPISIEENSYHSVFIYNEEGQRVKMEVTKSGKTQLVRHYLGSCYEKDMGVDGTKEKLYLGGDYYSAPAVYVKQGSATWQLYYICRDYLGSITHLVAANGSLTQELSFGAWGRLRNPANQVAYAPGSEPSLFLGRGYTGHEHLPWFGLINMNGRLYDPAVGRFLSPDNYVQSTDFSQSFNRYSYCLNNPLKYFDSTGYTWFTHLGKWINSNLGKYGQAIVTTAVTIGVAVGVTALIVASGGTLAPLAVAAIAGAASGLTGAALSTAFAGGSGMDFLKNCSIGAGVGALSGMAGYGVGRWAAKVAQKTFSFANGLSSPVLNGAIAGGISNSFTGGVIGYAGGFISNYLSTWDLKAANKAGLNSAKMGAILGLGVGMATGAYGGYKYAKSNYLNPWSGKSLTGNGIESQVPQGWISSPSKKGGGIIYKDPNNPHNSMRIMPGNPNSPNPAQQNPYVIYKSNGISYDVNGFPLPNAQNANAHIPINQFDINKMPW